MQRRKWVAVPDPNRYVPPQLEGWGVECTRTNGSSGGRRLTHVALSARVPVYPYAFQGTASSPVGGMRHTIQGANEAPGK